ncbi:MAG: hypothetical protein L6Q97_13970, partial [Thermoanaerobaculia bacterium]|nr:hypothetical protein [Thermoanaerobaculia bacterium]
ISDQFSFGKSMMINSDLEIELSAQAQRYYVLGHAALVHGILLGMNYEKPKYKIKRYDLLEYLLIICFILSAITFILSQIPGLGQIEIKFQDLVLVSSTLLLAESIIRKKPVFILLSGCFFIFSLYRGLLSGFKEEIIVPIIMLSSFLYPKYKKVVLILSSVTLSILIILLPSYVEMWRKFAWTNQESAEKATQKAIEAIAEINIVEFQESSSNFLLFRMSEIHMFNRYLRNVPRERPYYGFQIINQGILNLLPRIIYKEKPNTEELVMERVFQNNVVDRRSIVSAKPPLLVDGYLSFGGLGVLAFCLLMGWGSACASVIAERYFGGYYLGTCVVYTGLFQVFWRGNCFEFLINTVLWSFVILYLLITFSRLLKLIEPV